MLSPAHKPNMLIFHLAFLKFGNKKLENSIKAYGKKFYEENDLSMSFTMPYSRNSSCHQRAHLITPEEHNILYSWQDKLEVIHLKWHKQTETLKKIF